MTPAARRSPLPVARRAQLLDALQRHGTVRISELIDILGVTAVTVRRDIDQLATEGRVLRVHGGVTLARPIEDGGEPASSTSVKDERGRRHAAGESRTAPQESVAEPAIGILVPSLDYYWPGVVRGAEEAARLRNLRLVLRGSSYESDDDLPQLTRLIESVGVDGLMFAPNLTAPNAAATMEWLAKTGLPVVLVERSVVIAPYQEAMESVVSDHALGAAMAVHHLASLGHTRIGLVLSEHSPTSPHLRRGWLEATAKQGVDAGDTVDAVVPAPQAHGWGEALATVLARCRQTRTTALLVHADEQAIGLVQRCEDFGITVPGDLSVVAYDDEVASLFSPSLTAVRPPRRSIGRAAVELLAARLGDPTRPAHRVVISPTLQIRQSSRPPGVRE
jgi:DNA-binding LacI/PurR family transcriptional regulator